MMSILSNSTCGTHQLTDNASSLKQEVPPFTSVPEMIMALDHQVNKFLTEKGVEPDHIRVKLESPSILERFVILEVEVYNKQYLSHGASAERAQE